MDRAARDRREAGLAGPPPRRWEFVGTIEAPDYIGASRELARLPGRYAAIDAQTLVVE